MTRTLVCAYVAMSIPTMMAQQTGPAALPTLPPADRPTKLIAAQQLALAAYPELRKRGLQMRVEERIAPEATITFGFADPDGDTLLALSRPRTAALVLDAVFDADQRITRATMRGALARTQDRRDLRSRTIDGAEALEQAGAVFPPSKQSAFAQQLDRDFLRGIVGRLRPVGITFQTGTVEVGLYWDVAATSENGEHVTLRFEPYAGRLIEFVRGGGE